MPESKTKTVQVRVTGVIYAWMQGQAMIAGQSVSEWVRGQLEGGRHAESGCGATDDKSGRL